MSQKKNRADTTQERERERAEDHALRSLFLSFFLLPIVLLLLLLLLLLERRRSLLFYVVREKFVLEEERVFWDWNLKHSRAKFFNSFLRARARTSFSLSLVEVRTDWF